jgi:hypothetical protein
MHKPETRETSTGLALLLGVVGFGGYLAGLIRAAFFGPVGLGELVAFGCVPLLFVALLVGMASREKPSGRGEPEQNK